MDSAASGQLKKSKANSVVAAAAAAAGSLTGGAVLAFFIVAILMGAFISARWINDASASSTAETLTKALNLNITSKPKPNGPKPAIRLPFSCPTGNQTKITACPPRQLPRLPDSSLSPSPSCPDYFRWIHEDLRPWQSTGITQEMMDRAREKGEFHVVILDGRLYTKRYRYSYQSRDVFTLWGILQLLRRYPGRVPDLELIFNTEDRPVVHAREYRGPNAPAPPPLFRYCGDDSSIDIAFPDWSFWGWPEINVEPWEPLKRALKEGSERVKWMEREPYAYWRGNPAVSPSRQELLGCNVSSEYDWNGRFYAVDWRKESKNGFKEANLANQCTHRYKIYIEGIGWSVSEKYILACDSLALLVKPRYHDFFTRGLMPLQHYWPMRNDAEKCESVKFAVEWGNSHKEEAQAIGKEASDFIHEKLNMDFVYDYMLHVLTEYSKLLRYKPTRPPQSVELCSGSMACLSEGLRKKFMMESMVKSPHDSAPCKLPPPYSPAELQMLERRKANATKQVEMWQQSFWEREDNKPRH